MFIYHNQNPQELILSDCVTRAISTALDIPYYEVAYMLRQNGKFYECEELCVDCYEKLLTHDFQLPCFRGCGRTAEEVASDFPNDTLILRMVGHLSCSINGKIWDTWDSSDKVVTQFWIVK